ncbi:uncharacterized protein B0P05DRAFT_536713 [Gilbertella persicaria]|uniref:uncharacterized protein n=1 Tax=Gilbertella persicaria TaxID=101096 RepID=UPI00221F9F7C|nr:uncharacterized protein B0P05DRAFT_536713 [Gilbertella persicaria]KAI8083258.1 hypothetical protein B0P05DRAFT_536713 [Gilbertella persicaria]
MPIVMAQTKSVIPLTKLGIGLTREASGSYYQLECNPNGGNHPKPDITCAFVYSLNGNLSQTIGRGRDCQIIAKPFAVTVIGEYEGEEISYHEIFENECQARNLFNDLFPNGK